MVLKILKNSRRTILGAIIDKEHISRIYFAQAREKPFNVFFFVVYGYENDSSWHKSRP
jgi:hypothetical protein